MKRKEKEKELERKPHTLTNLYTYIRKSTYSIIYSIM